MKKIILMLAIAGITLSGVEAQTTNTALKNKACATHVRKAKKAVLVHHRPLRTETFVKTHQVCTEENGYYTCCVYSNTATTGDDIR